MKRGISLKAVQGVNKLLFGLLFGLKVLAAVISINH